MTKPKSVRINPAASVAERLQAQTDSLTRAERQLADLILDNYPVSALGSITTVAQDAGISTPTVARLVQKLGYTGFPEFQAALRRELEERISGPIAKHDTWTGRAPEGHILNRFAEAGISNIRQSIGQIDAETFDASCELLADKVRAIYVVGGRITRTLADYFYLHMQVIRPRVTHIPTISNAWPHYLLDVEPGDVLVIFDVRRYEASTLKLAEMAHERGATIILFTDQWRSPVYKLATRYFSSRIIVPSAWDSSLATLLLLETMIADVQERLWSDTRTRMESLEEMFDRTRFFRKFI
ncbi:MurR/RpiR family transcriptional regulator [Allohahella sp. A8]|uniref:MurR/RpiR family transcriptional regulator n=1 Tax=Allohahella sp. A8 TaxID=3141461 RepID=UPI000C09A689|nr:RpiR family transcriptional regulator [Hahellaceae bacterium]|tara:strand:- start:122918 stop:123811 length:894 start_codon:yes stop_codon:yes gene_type:complete